jgi:serine/threonine protein kinase
MITPAGVVRVPDFGLPSVTQPSAASEGDPANSPTLTMRATQAGMIMGTAAYMSPEQASGKPVDKRADIRSFGVVLWEMLTGRRLFHDETISHTLAAVLTKEPDLQQVPVKVDAVQRRSGAGRGSRSSHYSRDLARRWAAGICGAGAGRKRAFVVRGPDGSEHLWCETERSKNSDLMSERS